MLHLACKMSSHKVQSHLDEEEGQDGLPAPQAPASQQDGGSILPSQHPSKMGASEFIRVINNYSLQGEPAHTEHDPVG